MLLYKYFPPERNSFLNNRLVRFTQPGLFNDPFDAFPAITGYDEERAKQHVERNALNIAFDMALGETDDIEPGLTLNSLILSTVELKRKYAADPGQIGVIFQSCLLGRMQKQIGILCLTENQRSILMWSHYAKDHKGFVVGFDSENEFFKQRDDEPDEIGLLLPVRYVKKRPSIDVNIIETDKPAPDFLFSKNQEWTYEQEWRIIRFLKNADETRNGDVYLFNVPPSAIREIVIGSSASADMANELFAEAEKRPELNHVKFYKAKLSRTEYEMDLSPFLPK